MMKKIKTLAIATAVMAMTSCTEDISNASVQDGRIRFAASIVNDEGIAVTRAASEEHTVNIGDERTPLYVHTTVTPRSQAMQTRGTQINNLTDFSPLSNFKFGVSAYSYGTTPLANQYANIFYDAEAVRNEGTWWTSVPYYWPASSDKMAFYAYWPYSANCTGGYGVTNVYGGSNTETGPMKLHFKVNPTISQQQDLMYAFVQNKTFDQNSPVALPFHHALTAVNFTIGPDMAPGYIKKIELLDIAIEGDYTVGSGWTTTATGDITLDFTGSGGYNTVTGDSLINNSYGALLMIPQEFKTSTPKIRLYINDSDDGTTEANDHNLYKELQLMDKWAAGTVVTYQLSTSSINYLRITDVEYPTQWGDETFALKSSYDTDEAIGVYVVDETGKVINANVRYWKTATGWTTDNPENTAFRSDYKFFAYYPYTANISGGHAVGDSFTGSEASDFFSGIISDWTINADQSDKDYFLSRDLQICRSEAVSSSKLKFPMKHHMGLAVLNLQSRQVPYARYYLNNGTTTADTYTSSTYYDSYEKTLLKASDAFTGNILCAANSETKYYYMTKGAASPTFRSSSTGEDRWNSDVQIAVTSWGASASGTAEFVPGSRITTQTYCYKGWYFPTVVDGGYTFSTSAGKDYKLEVWGGQGGKAKDTNASNTKEGGKGGFSYGTITTSAAQTLYIVVGGKGAYASSGGVLYSGGYNGGGNGCGPGNTSNFTWSPGGGATHIATAKVGNGLLLNYSSTADQQKVLIVAGGGGGTTYYSAGGVGGGEDGGHGGRYVTTVTLYNQGGDGGSQTTGGVGWCYNSSTTKDVAANGGFGYGANYGATNKNIYCAGGGAGWYGGGASWQNRSGGGGGSGYIGGVQEPKATIAGNLSQPYAGYGAPVTGHEGAGYARITLLEF